MWQESATYLVSSHYTNTFFQLTSYVKPVMQEYIVVQSFTWNMWGGVPSNAITALMTVRSSQRINEVKKPVYDAGHAWYLDDRERNLTY